MESRGLHCKVWDCMREREEGAAMEKDGIIEEKENGGE